VPEATRDLQTAIGAPFGEAETARFPWTATIGPERLIDMVASRSRIILLPPDERAAVLSEVRRLLATHPQLVGRTEFEVPYVTLCLRATLPASRRTQMATRRQVLAAAAGSLVQVTRPAPHTSSRLPGPPASRRGRRPSLRHRRDDGGRRQRGPGRPVRPAYQYLAEHAADAVLSCVSTPRARAAETRPTIGPERLMDMAQVTLCVRATVSPRTAG
jgi:hypothetical protein